MISSRDFVTSEGCVDWVAYNKACVAAGESCYTCGSFILFAAGCPSQCFDCKKLASEEHEVTHDSMIRCPHCRHQRSVDGDDYALYSEGSHDVFCNNCNKRFSVEVQVYFKFTSPAMCVNDDE